jgi:hypothetical protein
VFNHFTGTGLAVGNELCEAPAILKLCADTFASVWERAVPHANYRPDWRIVPIPSSSSVQQALRREAQKAEAAIGLAPLSNANALFRFSPPQRYGAQRPGDRPSTNER